MPETEEERQDGLDAQLSRLNLLLTVVGSALALGYLAWTMLDTAEGQIAVARVKAWWARQTEGCEGCKRRKELLRAAWNRTAWDISQLPETETPEGHPG